MNFLDIENGVMTIRTTDVTRKIAFGIQWERVTCLEDIARFVERFGGETFHSSSLDFAEDYTTDPNVIALCDEVVNGS